LHRGARPPGDRLARDLVLIVNSGPSLRERVLRAALWAGGSHVMAQAIRFGGNLVLTRLLLPEAFGLMAVISTLMMGLNLVSDIGSGVVIIQSRRGTEQEFLNTAWTLQAMRGFAVWFVGITVSLLITLAQAQQFFRDGTVYDDARLPMLIAVATFAMAINGLGSVNGKLAERRLDLRRLAAIDLGAQLVALSVMIVGAALTGSIWSLVAGGLVSPALKSVLTHTLLPGPPARLRLERAAVGELLGKGKWVILSSLLGFFALNGDRFLLGGLVDGTTLGLYSIAFGLASIASAAITVTFAKVIFPAFSEVVRNRPAQLGDVYRRFQRAADAGLGLLAGFMFIAAELVVEVLYDPRYEAAGPIFAVLAISTIGVRFLVVDQIYLAMGRTGLLALAYVPRVSIVLAGLPLGFAVAGLDGALVAIVLSYFGHWPVAVWFRSKHHLNQLRNDIVLPAAIALGAFVGWALVRGVAWLGVA